MAKQTIQNRLVQALEKRGYQKVTATLTRKYLVYTHSDNPTRKIYLGKSGALRVGHNVSDSIPGNRLRVELLAEVSE